MRAVTLHAPWATAIERGLKHVETRSWPADQGAIGKYLAIHQGMNVPAYAKEFLRDQRMLDALRDTGVNVAFDKRKLVTDMPLGAVVAVARLVDATPTDHIVWHGSRSPDGLAWWPFGHTRGRRERRGGAYVLSLDQQPWGDFSDDRYVWLLDSVVPLARPVPVGGHQGIWRLKADGLCTACRELVRRPEPFEEYDELDVHTWDHVVSFEKAA